jgi:hypothetical protein
MRRPLAEELAGRSCAGRATPPRPRPACSDAGGYSDGGAQTARLDARGPGSPTRTLRTWRTQHS